MLNLFCLRCGNKISENDILGLGHFDQQIGKYKGKGFIVFKCPKCKKNCYQVLEMDSLTIYKKNVKAYNNYPSLSKNSDKIDLDQVIDFYQILTEIDTIDSFLKKCEITSEVISIEMKKPIIQPLDVYNLFCELNSSNLKRLMILTLDENNYPITWEFLGEGTHKPINFEPKTIFCRALLSENKVSVIIAQNLSRHFIQPSQKDILMTKRLIRAGKVLGIDFLDYIIIEGNGFHSFDQLNFI